MKRNWILTAVLVASLSPFIAGCKKKDAARGGNQTAVQPGSNNPAATEAPRFGTMKEDFKADEKKAADKLDEYGKRIDELGKTAAKATGGAKEKLDAVVKALKEQKDAAAKDLDRLRAAGAERWAQARERLNKALDELGKGIDKAVAELKK